MGKGTIPKRLTKPKGYKTSYIHKEAALSKLQLTLPVFRRLCILKGIYPHHPQKAAKLGSGRQYYLKKDISYLMREPLVHEFRKQKIYERQLKRYDSFKDERGRRSKERQAPIFKLDRIVRERYPTFNMALRDLDDSLTLMRLISKMQCDPEELPPNTIRLSRRLTSEFMQYVIATRSLRRVFVSIKGIYYQAQVLGETITWIEPYNFCYETVPTVDLGVMCSFSDFYVYLMGFVNYKLYTDSGLTYPPVLKDANEPDHNLKYYEKNDLYLERLESLTQVLEVTSLEEEDIIDEIPTVDQAADGEVEMSEDLEGKEMVMAIERHKQLFKDLKIFLNRETMRQALTFVIRSFGGTVSWHSTSAMGATFEEDDPNITHQIVDRPNVNKTHLTRYYVQPQWIFDCVNAQELVPVDKYFPGSDLPPHLSPFTEKSDYQPPEARPKEDRLKESDSDDSDPEEVIESSDEGEHETAEAGPEGEESSSEEEGLESDDMPNEIESTKQGKKSGKRNKAQKTTNVTSTKESDDDSVDIEDEDDDDSADPEEEEDEDDVESEAEEGDSESEDGESDLESFDESDGEEEKAEDAEEVDPDKGVDSDSSDDFVDMDKCHHYPEDQVDLQALFRKPTEDELPPLYKEFKTFDFELADTSAPVEEAGPKALTLFLKYEIGHLYQSSKQWVLYVQGRKGQAINNIVERVMFTVNGKNTVVKEAPFRITRKANPQEVAIKVSFKNERSTKHKYTIPANDGAENVKGTHFVKQLFKTYDPEKMKQLQEAGAASMAVTTGKLTRVTQEEVDQEAQEHRKLREMNIANKNKYKYNLLMKRKARNQAETDMLIAKRKAYDTEQKKLKKKKSKIVSDNFENLL